MSEVDSTAAAAKGASRRMPAASKAATKELKRGNWFARTVNEASTFEQCSYVPVAFVAKDWNVTSRRIRSLLAEQRLTGRQGANGYWEVAYPYCFIIGTRGPALKRQQRPKRGRPKSEERAEPLAKNTLQEVGK